MEGPVPTDPSVLDNGAGASNGPPPTYEQSPVSPPSRTGTPSRQPAARQPQTHQLLSASIMNKPAAAPAQQPAAAPSAPAAPANDLFSLDFHAPAQSQQPATQQQPAKDVKQDIMSLFSTPASTQPPPASNNFGQWGAPAAAAPAQASSWGTPQPQAVATPPVSMMGQSGVGMWGASSGWAAPAQPAQSSLWGAPATNTTQPTPDLFASGNDVWGAPASAQAQSSDPFGSFASPTTNNSKKDDAFGDLWGDFK